MHTSNAQQLKNVYITILIFSQLQLKSVKISELESKKTAERLQDELSEVIAEKDTILSQKEYVSVEFL